MRTPTPGNAFIALMSLIALSACEPDPPRPPAPPDPPPAPPAPRADVPTDRRPAAAVRIAGGTFGMGPPDARRPVSVRTFALDRTEVTVEAYAACVLRERCTPPDVPKCVVYNPEASNWQTEGRARHPINCVTWHQAVDYCEFVGGRLPTEAEWEYAARGHDGRRFAWGNEPPNATLLNYNYIRNRTVEVGSYPRGASFDGLLDIAGNVMEWVHDWEAYDAYYEAIDPRGAPTGTLRSARGMAWDCVGTPGSLDAWYSPGFHPDYGMSTLGFRCAYDE